MKFARCSTRREKTNEHRRNQKAPLGNHHSRGRRGNKSEYRLAFEPSLWGEEEMREVLFRGKERYSDGWKNGLLIKGTWYLDESELTVIVPLDVAFFPRCELTEYYEVMPETVGEFTGLHNGAGQKIFEDDIVRFEGNLYRVRREDETPGGVWSSTAYILQQIGWDCLMSFEDTIDEYSNEICVEIVGNIHDNPELLKWERKENESTVI